MPKHFALAAVAAFAVAQNIQARVKAYNAAQLYLTAVQTYEETEAANHAQIAYLVSLLEQHDIEPTEFDLIALNYHSES